MLKDLHPAETISFLVLQTVNNEILKLLIYLLRLLQSALFESLAHQHLH